VTIYILPASPVPRKKYNKGEEDGPIMSWAWEEMEGKQSGIQGCLWALLDHDLHGIINCTD
jgi:hypothetical protein